MVDKELLQKKILLQKIRNEVSKIEGISVLDYEENDFFDKEILREIGYYGDTKQPEDAITMDVSEKELLSWIMERVTFKEAEICYLPYFPCLVKIQFLDVKTALRSMWLLDHHICILTLDKKWIYEVGSDSRDEYHTLFDRYHLPK